MEKFKDKVALMVKVRERGKFWLRRIHLEQLTIEELRERILEKWNDPEKGEIISIYELWDREREANAIKSTERVRSLKEGHELEIIFENPGDKDRSSYTTWWNERHKGQQKN